MSTRKRPRKRRDFGPGEDRNNGNPADNDDTQLIGWQRRDNSPGEDHNNGSADDHAATELLASIKPAPEDGTTIRVAAAPGPLATLRAEPRYQPPEPVPAGYAATTGPMPAIGRPAISIGDALTRDDQWGPKLAPLPCGHCGTPPPVPDSILDRTRIIGHVNWLAGQAGWAYDTDLILTCPPCQATDAWKIRQGQLEVRWPDGGYCYRHGTNDPDAGCACPGAVLTVDVMLASEDYRGNGRHRRTAGAS